MAVLLLAAFLVFVWKAGPLRTVRDYLEEDEGEPKGLS